MSLYIHKSHNVSVLLYHIVCLAKYREIVLSNEVDNAIKKICIEISKRYEMHFVEIGADKDHVHFLVQSVPTYSPTKIVRSIKSITVREIFRQIPSIKKELWNGEFWTDGYYINTVSKRGNEDVVFQYVKKQGNEGDYEQLHFVQLKLI